MMYYGLLCNAKGSNPIIPAGTKLLIVGLYKAEGEEIRVQVVNRPVNGEQARLIETSPDYIRNIRVSPIPFQFIKIAEALGVKRIFPVSEVRKDRRFWEAQTIIRTGKVLSV